MNTTACPPDAAPPTPDQALARALARVTPVTGTETLALAAALGRVLAVPVTSALDVPAWDNSAMDGYALRHADLAMAADGWLPVSQYLPAGTAGTPLAPGTAARIFTGAPVPAGADTVVMQEVCECVADRVRIPRDSPLGTHIRRAGEELRAGATAIAAGTRLDARHLGLAAAAGAGTLEVHRRLRVAMLTSGDELAPPGQPLAPGQIHDSNRLLLTGLLRALDCDVRELGIVADTLEASCAALADGAHAADLVLASGGVSVGGKDWIRPALERLGTLEFWNVAIRPGKPAVFGTIAGTPFLGAPGNPVSLFTIFCILARPLILRMQGRADDAAPRVWRVRAGFDWPRPDTRQEYHRARLATGADGQPEAIVHPSRSSAVLSSVTWAEGLVRLEPKRAIRRGDPVDFIPFTDLLGAL